MQISGVELESLQFENIGSWPIVIRRALIVCIGLVTIFIGYLVDLGDSISTWNTVKQERINAEQKYSTIHHQAVNLDAYRKQVTEVRATLDFLTQQLPRHNEEAQLLEEISQQAAGTGLQFRSIKPLEREYKGFYVEQPVELSFTGTYNSFGEFVSNISNLPRIVTLHDFSLKDEAPGSGRLIITVVAKTYWTGYVPEGKKP